MKIDAFIDRVKKTIQSKGKELRLNMDEANLLMTDLNALLRKQNDLLIEISKLKDDLLKNSHNVMAVTQKPNKTMTLEDVDITDGGRFGS